MQRGRKTDNVRRLKHEAHLILESHFPNRALMYSWIQENFKNHHIADMGEDELKRVIKAGKRLTKKARKYV